QFRFEEALMSRHTRRFRSDATILVAFLLLTASAPHPHSQLDWLQRAISQGRFAEAAKELQQVVLQSGPGLKKPAPAEEKVLRRTIETTRRFLKGKHTAQEKSSAHQVLCLSRAYFPEDLPGLKDALRVGGAVHRPELIGDRVQRFPPEARRLGIQGVVIVE